MNIYLYIISGIAFYQAQKYLLPTRAIWSLFKDVKKHTPTFIPFELEHPEQEFFFQSNHRNIAVNPYKQNPLWFIITNP